MKTTKEIVAEANEKATAAAEFAVTAHPESNGSEAWQSVVVMVDGRSKVAKELLAEGFRKESYYGILMPYSSFSNYYAEEAYTTVFAGILNQNGISARRVERLL